MNEYAFADINLDIENLAATADDIKVVDRLISERVFFSCVFCLLKAAILLVRDGFEQAAFCFSSSQRWLGDGYYRVGGVLQNNATEEIKGEAERRPKGHWA